MPAILVLCALCFASLRQHASSSAGGRRTQRIMQRSGMSHRWMGAASATVASKGDRDLSATHPLQAAAGGLALVSFTTHCLKFTPHSKTRPQGRRRPLNSPAGVSTRSAKTDPEMPHALVSTLSTAAHNRHRASYRIHQWHRCFSGRMMWDRIAGDYRQHDRRTAGSKAGESHGRV
jgi:hypothetical protein